MAYSRLIFSMIICTLFFLSVGEARAIPQTTAVDSAAAKSNVRLIDPSTIADLTNLRSLWDLNRLGGTISWFIILVGIVGMLTVVYKVFELGLDQKHSRELERLNMKRVTLIDMMRVIKNNKPTMLSSLFKYMLDLYQTRRSAEGFSDEIIDFVETQQNRFSAFQSRMAFFSDTAGALGLLGTVWGMFVTFFGGDLEKHKILSGMGVALVTTLEGLVVSIFINLLTTQTHSLFRRRIDKVTDLGNEFRLRLYQLEQTLDNSFPDEDDDPGAATNGPKYDLSEAVIEAVDRHLKQVDPLLGLENGGASDQALNNGSYKLVPISGDNQAVEVNTRLDKPFVVQIASSNGNSLANKPILFEVVQGNGKLANGRKQEEVLTDASGLAQTNLILGSAAGENRVRARLKDSDNNELYFYAWGKPTCPEQLLYIAGNHQNAAAGRELVEPFVVKVVDKYGNPVPDCPITYKVIKGRGFFPEKKSIFITKTDDQGIAEAYFTLDSEPGFNSVRVSAKGVKKGKLEFEALGQG